MPITVLCILFLIGGLFLGGSNCVPGIMRDINSKIAAWYPNYLVVYSIIAIGCVIGLWMMKRWAFFAFALVAGLNQVAMAFAGDWRPANLILVAFFYYILFRYFPRTKKSDDSGEQFVAPKSDRAGG